MESDRQVGRAMSVGTADAYWVMYDATGEYLLTTGRVPKTVQIWRSGEGRPVGKPLACPGTATAAVVSPQGDALLVVSDMGRARLFSWPSGRRLGPALSAIPSNAAKAWPCVCVGAWQPDGRAVAWSGDQRRVGIADVPQPVLGDAEDIRRQVEGFSGLRLLPDGAVEALSPAE